MPGNPEQCKREQRVLTPEEIQAKWAAEAQGKAWVPPWKEVPPSLAKPVDKPRQGDPGQRSEKMLSTDPAQRTVTALDMKRRLDDLLRAYGMEPAEELIKLATARDDSGNWVCDTDQRIAIWTKLLEYRMPKLKALEVSGQIDHEINVVVKKFGPDDLKVVDVPSVKRIEFPDGMGSKSSQ